MAADHSCAAGRKLRRIVTLASALAVVGSGAAQAATISGHVLSGPENSPASALSGAQVTAVLPQGSEVVASATAALDGSYSMEVPPGTYKLVMAPPFGSSLRTVVDASETVSATRTVNFVELAERAPPSPEEERKGAGSYERFAFLGQLMSADGRPVVGAQLTLSSPQCPGVCAATSSGPSGAFSLAHSVTSGRAALEITGTYPDNGAHFRFTSVAEAIPLAGGFHERLTLPRTTRLTVEPVDGEGHSTSMSAEGELKCQGLSLAPGVSGEAALATPTAPSSALGVDHFTCPGTGSITLSGEHLSALMIPVTLAAGDTTIQPAQPSSTFSGRVVGAAGIRLAGATVKVGVVSTVTDSSGAFSMHVRPGSYRLIVSGSRPRGVARTSAPDNYYYEAETAIDADESLTLTLPLEERAFRLVAGTGQFGQGHPGSNIVFSANGYGSTSSPQYLAPGLRVLNASFSTTGDDETNSSGVGQVLLPAGLTGHLVTDAALDHQGSFVFFLPGEVETLPHKETVELATYAYSGGAQAGVTRTASGEVEPDVGVEWYGGEGQRKTTLSNAHGEYAIVWGSPGTGSCEAAREHFIYVYEEGVFSAKVSPCRSDPTRADIILPTPTIGGITLEDSSASVAHRYLFAACSVDTGQGGETIGGRLQFGVSTTTDSGGNAEVPTYEGATCQSAEFGEQSLGLEGLPTSNTWRVPHNTFHGSLTTTTGGPVTGADISMCVEFQTYEGCYERTTTAATSESGSFSVTSPFGTVSHELQVEGGHAGTMAFLSAYAEGLPSLTPGEPIPLYASPAPSEYQWALEAQNAEGQPSTGEVRVNARLPAHLHVGSPSGKELAPSEWFVGASASGKRLDGGLFSVTAGNPEDAVQTPYYYGPLAEGPEEHGGVTGDGSEIVALSRNTTEPTPAARPVVTATAVQGAGRGYAALSLTGEAFEGATAVACDGEPASSFTVESETAMTVHCNAGTGTGHVVVTGPGGSSAESPASAFTYPASPTGPVVNCAEPAGTGWQKENATVACTASDAVSGLAHPAEEASFTLSTTVVAGATSGSAYTSARAICDTEGLCTQAGPIGPFKIDRQAPTIVVSTPANNELILAGSKVSVHYSCLDEGSGVERCEGTLPTGQPLDTSKPGEYTLGVAASDNVGNAAPKIVHYTVVEPTECGPAQLCQTGVGDHEPPAIAKVAAEPEDAIVNTEAGAATVTLKVTATDKEAGTEAIQATLTNGTHDFSAAAHLQSPGTGKEGVWNASITLPEGAPKGTYALSIAAVDAVGNSHTYDASELHALGLLDGIEQVGNQSGAPPAVTSVTATPSSVDTCESAQTIAIEVGASVSPTSVAGVLVSLNGPASQHASANASLASGTGHNGVWRAELTLPRYSHAGTWGIEIQAWDTTHAETFLASPQLAAEHLVSTIEETCAGDSTPPTLTSVALSPTSVNTEGAPQTISAEFNVTDEQSGTQSLTATLENAPQSVSAPATLTAGTRANGTWLAHITIPRWSRQGQWKLHVETADEIGNTISLTGKQLLEAGVTQPEPIVTQTGQEDGQPPVIGSGTIIPSRIDTEAEPRTVQVRLPATDNLSGVEEVKIRFIAQDGQVVEGKGHLEEGGTSLNGTWQANLMFPQYSDEGAWSMEVEARDAFGNWVRYTPAQLASSYPTVKDAPPTTPTVATATPADGKGAGGTQVAITGTGFEDVSAVEFGTADATAVTVNSTHSITATAPAGSGTVDIRVVNEGVKTSRIAAGDRFTYAPSGPAPTITKLSPTKIPASGGTTVTVTGTGLSYVTGLTFGGVAATGYTEKSATSLTAVAPAGVAKSVDLEVTTPNGTTATTSADRVKVGPPTIATVAPSTGTANGGQTATVTGSGFALGHEATLFKFGTTEATVVDCTSHSSCEVLIPSHVAATVDIAATVNAQASVKSTADHYTYTGTITTGSPAVTKVAPTKVAPAGGATVTITGVGFNGASAVRFGAVPATSFTVKSATSITAVAPAQAAKSVDVTVATPNGTTAPSSADHVKYGPPAVSAVTPSSGSAGGGGSITVTGAGFALGDEATLFDFGTTEAAEADCASTTECTVLLPFHLAGTVDVKATVNGQASSKAVADQFAYH